MRQVTLQEIGDIASASRDALYEDARSVGYNAPKIYLHWTAGHYDTLFEDYHISITGDGEIYVSTDDFSEVLEHTWKRNTGGIGIAICGCYGAGSNDLGDEPPTDEQIQIMSQIIAVLANNLWLTIDKQWIMTHGEAANNEDGDFSCHDPYPWWNDSYGDGDTRGDLEYLGTEESPCYNPYATDGTRGGDVLRGKANWYRKEYGNKEG
jgi:hypothetical protein